ncbi:type 1 periplasmic binding fold superfamily protein [Flavobacterium sp. CYK-4]|uniref:type 1 periplasmic binding fold superfamily protein n=1 Tax=Flavobacterium lotistagni TaxID=2709660 RepID=UPI001409D466|nr:type 1 periplasmic binding fold superfamily protein [Flavobacterium lotistagni]NHM05967.1 type 1 periplasmic binding fold superfamily protein [Flavobacterium lotistagni]
MKTLKSLAFLLSVATIFTSCSSDNDSSPVNEEELITTITVVYTPEGGGSTITLESKDLDGDGPDAPVISVSGPFAQNTTYQGVVSFKNESVNPAEDITEEIVNEAEDHQIFYQKTGTLNNFTYASDAENLDANGKPIGLKSVFTTTNSASGTLKITLIHLPNKSAAGVSDGDITNAGGSPDAEAIFNITVN